MNGYATTVRMLHSGLVLHDSIQGANETAAQVRHEKLVGDMQAIVRGTHVRSREAGRLLSTIFVGGKPLIEVCTG